MTHQFRTILYLGILTGLLLAVGWWIGGPNGIMTAFVISLVMNLGSYWFSDRIVLFMYGAKEIPREASPELHTLVEELARRAQIPKPRLYFIDADFANAFATGRNPTHAAVAVTRGITHLLSKDELRGVLAHELAHVAERDVLIVSIAATIAGAITMLARLAYWGGAVAGRDRNNRTGDVLSFLFLVIVTPILALFIQLAVSRAREYHADVVGARYAGSGQALAAALEKLHSTALTHPIAATPGQSATAHLFIVNPFKARAFTRLFSTHPPVEERVRRLRGGNAALNA